MWVADVNGDGKLDLLARETAHAEFRKAYEQRTEFMNEERTGFVWLYLRQRDEFSEPGDRRAIPP